jgi:hypothetical protein
VTDRRDFLKALGTTAVAATVGGLGLLRPSRAEAATQRPISDFLNAQGSIGPLPGFQTPFFVGWYALSGLNGFVDYAGVTNSFLLSEGINLGTRFTGSVTERPLPGGTAEVTVVLQTKNALAAGFGPTGTILFGFGTDEIQANPSVGPLAVGDSVLQVVFQNTAPGAPLPDLVTIFSFPPSKTVSFRGTATGPLRAASGVPEGTPGQMTISQTGLLATAVRANPHSRVAFDAFPAELVNFQVVGR